METTAAFAGLRCVDCGEPFEAEVATHRCPDCGGMDEGTTSTGTIRWSS